MWANRMAFGTYSIFYILFIYSFLNDTFLVARLYSLEWEDDSEQRIGKDVERSSRGVI